MKYIVGLGTGRCGTVSLAKLLNAQPGVAAYHEARQPDGSTVPWEPAGAESPISRTLRLCANAQTDAPGTHTVVDVAFWHLPYLSALLEHFPTLRAVVLIRGRDETVESFIRKTYGDRNPNRWSAHAEQAHPFDPCFPKYDVNADDAAEGARRYWHEYYSRVLELQASHPGRVLIHRTEHLNDDDRLRELLLFCGVGLHDQRLTRCHENRTA